MLSITQNFRPAAILWLCCVFVASPILAEESPDEIELQPGYGYLLIRVIFSESYKIDAILLTNIDTGDVIRTNSRMYKSAGLHAWMCLVAVPEGRYFSSRIQYGYPMQPGILVMSKQEAPRSASDFFEIVPGVINYAGDWVIKGVLGTREPSVNHNIKTLEWLIDRYPEHANTHEIYLSMMGKKSVSLRELQKLDEDHQGSVTE